MVEDLVVAEQSIKKSIQMAQQKAREYLAKHGETAYCGFAWTTVYDVRSNSKLGKLLGKYGFTKAYGGGLQLWNPSGLSTQSMDIKEIGADTCADVLRSELGLKAYGGSRAD